MNQNNHHRDGATQKPLTREEIRLIATYAPEGVSDDDVEDIVRRVEEKHGIGESE